MIDLGGAEHRKPADVRRHQFLVVETPSLLDVGEPGAVARPAGHLPHIDRVDAVGGGLEKRRFRAGQCVSLF